MLQITELYVYPIKSLGGISLRSAIVTDRGLEHDRRWMLVDHNNRFLSQRELPQMALLKLSLLTDGLLVTDNTEPGGSIRVPFEPQSSEIGKFMVWYDVCDGQYVGFDQDQWFSSVLNYPCRLVYMPNGSRRTTDPKYTSGEMLTSFSDGYPFMLIGQASLDELNTRLDVPLPMDRFRPNIVFSGGRAFEEDQMAAFKIGTVDFFGVKLCARCPITTIDQQTAQRGKEPLKTFATYRQWNNKVYFGQNLVHSGSGTIRLGDLIDVSLVKEMPNALIKI